MGDCPAHSSGAGTGWYLRPIPTEAILWFCDSSIHLKLWCTVCVVQKTDPLPEFALSNLATVNMRNLFEAHNLDNLGKNCSAFFFFCLRLDNTFLQGQEWYLLLASSNLVSLLICQSDYCAWFKTPSLEFLCWLPYGLWRSFEAVKQCFLKGGFCKKAWELALLFPSKYYSYGYTYIERTH